MASPKIQPTSILSLIKGQMKTEAANASGTTLTENLSPTLTYGPNINEVQSEIPFNQGTAIYDVYLLQQLSSDIILIYGSLYSQLYRRTRSANRSRHTPRSVKDQLFKENFPVHRIRNR
jgi:hypothetical protein